MKTDGQHLPTETRSFGKRVVLIALFLTAAVAISAAFGVFLYGRLKERPDVYPQPPAAVPEVDTGAVRLFTRTAGQYFYVKADGVWSYQYLKGVNMGLTLPNTDLTNPDIPYQTYMEWFGDISAMNANTVRVFTVMNPDFYRAFYDYNMMNCGKPLYLMHGIWINENDMYHIGDAFAEDGTILNNFKRSVRETVDIVNGRSDYTSYGTIQQAVYDKDISRFVVGYVLGLEWMPQFVLDTNRNHTGREQHTGQYLYTRQASPFEVFLCEVGDELIRYETETYAVQHPVAFLNWSTTDVLTHTNEPFEEEDSATLNTEVILSTPKYYAGQFAAVDVYPYYPEFMNHQPEYLEYRDENGCSDPYRAYLKDLISRYTMPVVVAEFGVPTSRGVAHISAQGYHQGGITEHQQGEMIVAMLKAIAKEGCAGSMIFSWQDEWFKQTWNTIKYAPEKAADRSLNVQSAEQRYGIVAYEPGWDKAICYPDGDDSEWSGATLNNNGVSVSLKYDAAYLYLLLKTNRSFRFNKDQLAVAFSTTGRGNATAKEHNLTFERPVDFLLIMDGKTNTRLLCDAYYDLFYHRYAVERTMYPHNSAYERTNSGIFNRIQMLLSNEMTLPLTSETLPPVSYESGLLRYGNANPDSGDYDSLADFCAGDGFVEIRLPWYLLNIMNPSEKIAIGDLYDAGGVSFVSMTQSAVGAAVLDGPTHIPMTDFTVSGIVSGEYHKRFKQSYAMIQSFLTGFMEQTTDHPSSAS